jgi:exonuclease SbcD
LVDVGVRVVMTSGNHDSGPRLGFAASLIDTAGIHLRTDPAEVGVPVLLADAYGDVAVYGIPYLEPDLVAPGWDLSGRSHQRVLDEAMSRVRADLRCRGEGARSVVLAHAFVTGGRASESERDISVGGVQNVSVSTFDGVDYAALGHLHGRQTLAPGVRYCGSPLAYSFSEAGHVKGSWLVELEAAGVERVDFVPAPVPRRLARIRGRLQSLLRDPALAAAEGAWVHVTLTDAQRPKRAMEQIQQRFPHALVLNYDPEAVAHPASIATMRVSTTRSDIDVVADFFETVAGRPIAPSEAALVRRAFDACRVAEDVAS